jgi:hypothetical protein
MAARVSITRQRCISLNQAAYNLLGCPPAVVLLYAAGGMAIGLRADSEGTAYSFRVRPMGKGTNYLINATAFMRYHGIDCSRLTIFRQVAFEDGILILPFDQAYRKGQRFPSSTGA